MDIEKMHKGMLVATEEKGPSGRRTIVYGEIGIIDPGNQAVSIAVRKNGNESEYRTFDAIKVMPIHTLFNRKNRLISQLIGRSKTLEGFILALARGDVQETSAQEVLETLSSQRQSF